MNYRKVGRKDILDLDDKWAYKFSKMPEKEIKEFETIGDIKLRIAKQKKLFGKAHPITLELLRKAEQ